MTLLGVDGCEKGWVVAEANQDLTDLHFWIAVTAQEFFTRLDKDTFAAIDMPSGLPVSRPRACDLEARRVLSPHGARVFPAPARAALGATDYRECCALNLTALNTKLSKQSHALLSKIREVDDLMSPELQMRIREAHPEVTFATLAGHSLKHSKKVVAGNIERWDILAKSDLWIDPSRMDSLREIDAALDDVLDAAACLLTAKRISEGRERVLGDRALDAKGLRMEIVA